MDDAPEGVPLDQAEDVIRFGLCLVGVVLVCSGAAQPPAAGAPSRSVPAAEAGAVAAPAHHWARVLHRLDRRRARAYASADLRVLREVYLAGSAVLRRDRAVLRAYAKREIRLTGVRFELFAVRTRTTSPGSVLLRVVDRLNRPTAHTETGVVTLPQDRATRWSIRLDRTRVGWRIAAVRRVAG